MAGGSVASTGNGVAFCFAVVFGSLD